MSQDNLEALGSLLGEQAKGLSAATIGRLKAKWQQEHQQWQQRSLVSALRVCVGRWHLLQHPQRKAAVHSGAHRCQR